MYTGDGRICKGRSIRSACLRGPWPRNNAGAPRTPFVACLTFELTPTAEAGAVSPVRDDANAGTDRAYSACRSGSGVERGVRPHWWCPRSTSPRLYSRWFLPRRPATHHVHWQGSDRNPQQAVPGLPLLNLRMRRRHGRAGCCRARLACRRWRLALEALGQHVFRCFARQSAAQSNRCCPWRRSRRRPPEDSQRRRDHRPGPHSAAWPAPCGLNRWGLMTDVVPATLRM